MHNSHFDFFSESIGCSFKFPVKVGVEESIVNALRTTDHGSGVLGFYTIGGFTIDSSTPTLTGNLNEHPIFRLSVLNKVARKRKKLSKRNKKIRTSYLFDKYKTDIARN
jgi:hypothetical protein